MFQAVVWNGSTARAIVRESPEFSTLATALKWGRSEIAFLRFAHTRRKHWRGKILKDGLLFLFFGDHSR